MTEHAPGPWWIRGRHPNGEIIIRSDALELVATVPQSHRKYTAEDNARLVAAAPELLAACEHLVSAARVGNTGDKQLAEGLFQQAVLLAGAAIAKARDGR